MEKNLSLLIIMMLLFSGFFGVLNLGTETVEAVTFIENDITQNTTWESADSPYRIVTDITVQSGATLTIDSGVEVQFAEGKSLKVNGSFEATGNPDDLILFTSTIEDPEPGYWETIKFVGGENEEFNMNHCMVEYARNAVTIHGQSGEIKNSEFTKNSDSGVRIEEGVSNNTVENNLIHNNSYGIVSTPSGNMSDLLIAENRIINNADIGLKIQSDLHISNITLYNNEIFQNEGDGIEISAGESINYLEISANEIKNNSGHGINNDAASSSYELNFTRNEIYKNEDDGINLYAEISMYDITLSNNEIYNIGRDGINLDSDSQIHNISLDHNEITNSERYGINLNGYSSVSNIEITYSNISDNREEGINIYSDDISKVIVSENQVCRNKKQGIKVYADVINHDVKVRSNEVFSNEEEGVNIYGHEILEIMVSGNQVSQNKGKGIRVFADYSNSNLTVKGNEVFSNEKRGVNIASSFAYNITVNLNKIYENEYSGLYVKGDEMNPGVCVIDENIISSNNRGVIIENPVKTLMTNNSIGYNYNHGVEYSKYENNENHYNNIYGNRYGMNVTEGGTVDAERNFWGDESGPYHQSINPAGEGNPVNGDGDDLDFIPFLEDPLSDYPPKDSVYINIKPTGKIINAGDKIAYTTTAYNESDVMIGSVTKETEWTINDGADGNWTENEYESENAGTWTVTGTYQNLSDDAILGVEAADVDSVKIEPEGDMTIDMGEKIEFSAEAHDEYGNLITDNDTAFTWNHADESGLFNVTEPGEYKITATYNGVESEPTVVVVEGDNDSLPLWSWFWIIFFMVLIGLVLLYFIFSRKKTSSSSSSFGQGSSSKSISGNKAVCPNCGADNPEDAKFCQSCGEDIGGTVDYSEHTNTEIWD